MPTVSERAQAEAERDEQELDDDELEQAEEEEQHDEPEQPQPPAPPAEPTEAMWTKARKENERHHERLRAIMGDFIAGFVECEACAGSGLTIPEPPAPKLPKAPQTQRCPVCDGFGDLDTDSRKSGFDVIACRNCNGKGWVGPDNLPPEEAARLAVASIGANGEQAASTAPAPYQPQPAPTDPRADELRALGYTVVDPIRR
jgi:hypothetical protein